MDYRRVQASLCECTDLEAIVKTYVLLFIMDVSSPDGSVFFVIRTKRAIESRVNESDVPVSDEQRLNIFQTIYKEVINCKSKQPRGFRYMAKLPTSSERIKFQVEKQAPATVETQKVNSELSQQVTE